MNKQYHIGITTTVRVFTMILVLGMFAGVGCVTNPTSEQLAAADYGPKPSQQVAEAKARTLILEVLKDPESARITWHPLEKAWFRVDMKPNRFAWKLPGSVNAKNSFGGYVGDKPWYFYFRGDKIVGMGKPYSGRYITTIVCVEMDDVDWGDNPPNQAQ